MRVLRTTQGCSIASVRGYTVTRNNWRPLPGTVHTPAVPSVNQPSPKRTLLQSGRARVLAIAGALALIGGVPAGIEVLRDSGQGAVTVVESGLELMAPGDNPTKGYFGAKAGPSAALEYGAYPERAGYYCDRDCTVSPAVVLNSAIDNPVVGDERYFTAVALEGQAVVNRLTVEPGDTFVIRLYLNNNADTRLQFGGVAQDVNAKVLVPTLSGTQFNVVGFISARNAVPRVSNDTALVISETPVSLVPQVDSVTIHTGTMTDIAPAGLFSREGVHLGGLEPGTGQALFILGRVDVQPA